MLENRFVDLLYTGIIEKDRTKEPFLLAILDSLIKKSDWATFLFSRRPDDNDSILSAALRHRFFKLYDKMFNYLETINNYDPLLLTFGSDNQTLPFFSTDKLTFKRTTKLFTSLEHSISHEKLKKWLMHVDDRGNTLLHQAVSQGGKNLIRKLSIILPKEDFINLLNIKNFENVTPLEVGKIIIDAKKNFPSKDDLLIKIENRIQPFIECVKQLEIVSKEESIIPELLPSFGEEIDMKQRYRILAREYPTESSLKKERIPLLSNHLENASITSLAGYIKALIRFDLKYINYFHNPSTIKQLSQLPQELLDDENMNWLCKELKLEQFLVSETEINRIIVQGQEVLQNLLKLPEYSYSRVYKLILACTSLIIAATCMTTYLAIQTNKVFSDHINYVKAHNITDSASTEFDGKEVGLLFGTVYEGLLAMVPLFLCFINFERTRDTVVKHDLYQQWLTKICEIHSRLDGDAIYAHLGHERKYFATLKSDMDANISILANNKNDLLLTDAKDCVHYLIDQLIAITELMAITPNILRKNEDIPKITVIEDEALETRVEVPEHTAEDPLEINNDQFSNPVIVKKSWSPAFISHLFDKFGWQGDKEDEKEIEMQSLLIP